ncbi:hypothetical protein MY11210_007482 [Beauveria gryllotalpidicola]
MQLDQIQRWLNATEHYVIHHNAVEYDATEPNDDSPAAKRCRLDLPVTPPSSDTRRRPLPSAATTMATPPRDRSSAKRPLDDETPRAKRVQTSAPSERSHISLSSASSDHSSRRSTTASSPRKQLRALRLETNGLDTRDLAVFDHMPSALETLLDQVAAFADGESIVARDVQPALAEAAAHDRELRWALRGADGYMSDEPGLAGRTPSPYVVRKVVMQAAECNMRDSPEVNWNLEVHQLVLDMAFRPAQTTANATHSKNLINFIGCTTASILPDYGPPTQSKKVDFCLYIDPQHDAAAPATIFKPAAARVRDVLPHRILNFTDFTPLEDRFIAVSIETKKPSESFNAAQLQLGVWDMARWSLLRRLRSMQAGEETGGNAAADAGLPAFIPGVIVQGHHWYLVVTTAEGGRTVLWQQLLIGSTSSSRGVYQIVRTLQHLGDWARDVHWPWLRVVIEAAAANLEADV